MQPISELHRKGIKLKHPYVVLALETAVMCATENPAKEIGIYDKVGSISVGKQADFVLIDEELNIKRVYIDGKEIIC